MSTAPLPSLRIDFVSDVVCPWCAIGLASLEEAMRRVAGEIAVDLHLQPFELNPQLGADGEDAVEHLKAKYRIDDAQIAANQEAIRQRGDALGFTFDMGGAASTTPSTRTGCCTGRPTRARAKRWRSSARC